jgi:hypothetical protein
MPMADCRALASSTRRPFAACTAARPSHGPRTDLCPMT